LTFVKISLWLHFVLPDRQNQTFALLHFIWQFSLTKMIKAAKLVKLQTKKSLV